MLLMRNLIPLQLGTFLLVFLLVVPVRGADQGFPMPIPPDWVEDAIFYGMRIDRFNPPSH